MTVVLEVREATKSYRRQGRRRLALAGVSLSVAPGRTLAVVGESGAGKSTLMRMIAGLEQPDSGTVRVFGTQPRLRSGRVSPVQVVFQSPYEALNPYLSVGRSIAEPIRRLRPAARRARVHELMERVGLSSRRADARPSAFSGGQLQRIVIARALAAEPALLLCDEPTSALDVSVQAQIINLLLELQARLDFACVLVTHDLGVARVLAHDVLLLRGGRQVEAATADAFFGSPQSAYAQQLLAETAATATTGSSIQEARSAS